MAWPAWFAGADYLLIVMALGLAFLVSSFVARNPDLWLHLAAGKRLLSGEYHPGTDPFSYTASGRPWVNHSLLFDAGAYSLYGGDGALLVALKALAVVLTFGLLIGIRQPGYSYWPWAAAAGVAVLAAAPRLLLSPLVGSTLLLAATLFALFRFKHRKGSWQFPATIGVIFWVWAQVDSWFILGPIVLVLVILGELLQARFLKSPAPVGSGESPEPLGLPPDVATLAKALGIGLLACMLNPHHIRIWELPFELIGMKEGEADARLRAQLLATPLDKNYRTSGVLGYNLNGLAYVILFVGTGVVLGFGVGRIRFAHLTLWLGFASLSLATVFAIPFFAVVAVPLVASQLNAFSADLAPRDWDDRRTRFLILGSAAGRVICLVLFLAGCILAWPGWLQPPANSAAYARRVAWGIQPDAGLVRAAQQLQSWRESGSLRPETHGVILSIELANYCAWFAPLEKVFLNGNYNHHRTELLEYFAMRSALGASNTREVGEMFQGIGAEYLVLSTTQGDLPPTRKFPVELSVRLWADKDHWSPWYMDGRAAISGWNSTSHPSPPALPIQFDPVVLAFGPNVERLPSAPLNPIPQDEGWAVEFIHGVGMSPQWADEAIGWGIYKNALLQRQPATDQLIASMSSFYAPAAPGGFTLHQLFARFAGSSQRPTPDELTAIPILTLRAARRAIAANSDHPDSYYAMYVALSDPDLPISEAERTIGQVTALRQCLLRMPSPDRFKKHSYLSPAYAVARTLAGLYYGQQKQPGVPITTGLPLDFPSRLPVSLILGDSPLSDGVMGVAADETGRPYTFRWHERGQRRVVGGASLRAIDMAHEMSVLALKYADIELVPDVDSDAKMLKAIKKDAKTFEDELVRKNQDFEREKLHGGHTRVPDQVKLALRFNLVGEALRILTETKGTDLEKEYGQGVSDITLIRIALELATGRLEDAAVDLEIAPTVLESTTVPQNIKQFQLALLQSMNLQKLLFEGNFMAAGEILESEAARQMDVDPPLTRLESIIKSRPFFALGSPLASLQIAELAPVPPLGQPMRNALLSEAAQPFIQRHQKLTAIRRNSSEYHYRRGFLYLLDGDNPNARKQFELSHETGVPEWGVTEQKNAYAEHYRRLIDLAQKKTTK